MDITSSCCFQNLHGVQQGHFAILWRKKLQVVVHGTGKSQPGREDEADVISVDVWKEQRDGEKFLLAC